MIVLIEFATNLIETKKNLFYFGKKAWKNIRIHSPNGLSVECRFICRSRLASLANTLKHTLHMNILTPSWILPCDVRSTDVVNACPQTWQMNGLRSL